VNETTTSTPQAPKNPEVWVWHVEQAGEPTNAAYGASLTLDRAIEQANSAYTAMTGKPAPEESWGKSDYSPQKENCRRADDYDEGGDFELSAWRVDVK